MNGIVACTLTAADTNITCLVRIYLTKTNGSTPTARWELIGGSLLDIYPYGTFGWWKFNGGRLELIGEYPGFAAPYVPAGPIIAFDDKPDPYTVVQLSEVPSTFLDIVTPQNTIRGAGNLFATNDRLNWSMWYRTS